MKHCIFINQYATHLFTDIINDFVSKGINVELITGGIHSTHPLSPKVKIRKFNSYRRRSRRSRLLSWAFFGVRTFLYLLFKKSPLFLTTNPPFLPILAWWYRKIKNQSIYILYYDIYPDALERMGYLSNSSFLNRWWRRLNKKVLKSADYIFTISETLKGTLMEYDIDGSTINVIPGWTDNQFIKPLDKTSNPFAEQYNLVDKMVILYSGNLGITHDIKSLIMAAEQLIEKEYFHFVIIGEGNQKPEIEKLIRKKELKNITLLPLQPSDQLPYTFALADIGVVTLGSGAEGFSVPSKIYSYLAGGSAILAIAEDNSELGRLVTQYNCGEIFIPGDIKGISDYILKLSEDKVLLAKYKLNSRKASEDFGVKNGNMFFKIIDG